MQVAAAAHVRVLSSNAAENGEREGDERPDERDDEDSAKGQGLRGAVEDGHGVEDGKDGKHGPRE